MCGARSSIGTRRALVHWVVTVDGNVATFSSLVHASCALKSIGIVASPSRLYSEVYDGECRAQGIATPHRIVPQSAHDAPQNVPASPEHPRSAPAATPKPGETASPQQAAPRSPPPQSAQFQRFTARCESRISATESRCSGNFCVLCCLSRMTRQFEKSRIQLTGIPVHVESWSQEIKTNKFGTECRNFLEH